MRKVPIQVQQGVAINHQPLVQKRQAARIIRQAASTLTRLQVAELELGEEPLNHSLTVRADAALEQHATALGITVARLLRALATHVTRELSREKNET